MRSGLGLAAKPAKDATVSTQGGEGTEGCVARVWAGTDNKAPAGSGVDGASMCAANLSAVAGEKDGSAAMAGEKRGVCKIEEAADVCRVDEAEGCVPLGDSALRLTTRGRGSGVSDVDGWAGEV
jgi:hypothetical protein